jgi:16S rRNA G527 N7-methylase RsmG
MTRNSRSKLNDRILTGQETIILRDISSCLLCEVVNPGHNKRMMDGSGHGRHGLRSGLLCGSVKIYLLILSKGKRTNYLIYLLATLVTKRVRMIPILYTAIISDTRKWRIFQQYL